MSKMSAQLDNPRPVQFIGGWFRSFLLILLVFGFTAQAANFTAQTWCLAEIPLTSSVTYADPFLDVDVTATFTGPDGEVITRPGFWDGTNTWRVRFAPTVVGQWTMMTTCTDPSNAGLQGITNTVQCTPYTGPYPIYQHGFLKVSPNARYFTYADGTPFFYLGDTHWLYIHERFQTSNVPGVPSEFKYTVDKRLAEGFTVFQSEAIHIPQGGIHTNENEEPHAVLTNGFTAASLPGFWNIDQKFAYLATNGLVHANGFITWAAEPAGNAYYTPAYMSKLGRYWDARYGAYPVLWTTGQELDPNMYGTYNANTIGLWYAGAVAVATNDAYAQPLGVHMQSNGNGINSPADSSWGGKSYHKWWPMQLQGEIDGTILPFVESFYTNSPAKPIVLYETPYEDFWTSTDGARQDGYKGFQWGMCGYGYGGNGVWNDTYDYSNSDWATAYYMPGSYLKWYDGANLPGGAQMACLKNFYTALDWWNLSPRFNNPAWGSFADENESLLTTESNTTYVVYFFGTGTATGTLNGMATGVSYDAQWYNPRTGTYTDLGGLTPVAGQWTAPAKPDSEDWLLRVRQNPNVVFPTPANGATVSAALSQVSWTGSGSSSNLSYAVYFGSAADYDATQPNGNLTGITPGGGTVNQYAALPAPLQPGATYYWMLAVSNPGTGTTNYYTWNFTTGNPGGGTVAVGDASFETPKAGGVGGGWDQIGSPWVVAGTSPYQQNSLTPSTSAHFTISCPGGGIWYALINGNAISIKQDLQVNVMASNTVSMTFYGGRGQASSSTADGGVFNAEFLVGSTPYAMPVNTTTQANNSWQSYTLTRLVTNSGDLSIEFSAVSGDPWLDNITNVTITNVAATSTSALAVTVTNPADGEAFLTGAGITAAAAIVNGAAPYTVTYYTNAAGGVPVIAGTAAIAPYTLNLGSLACGTYQISAVVTDSASPSAGTAISFTHTFTVAPGISIPVSNPSFETPGNASTATGWTDIGAGWTAAINGDFQENNLTDFPGEHFTTISPGGGVWCALINGNTGSITQNLSTNVTYGDTLSMTFYGGRARDGSSTAEGGTFVSTFLVGSTPYNMTVDTSLLANNTWQRYTQTVIVTNSGVLSLEFSAVSGDPWVDNISDLSLRPASPYSIWIAGVPGVPAGETGFANDANGDGVANGLAWILGASSPLSNRSGLMPGAAANAGGTLTLTFDCLNPAAWGSATLAVEYSHDLATWVCATVPASSGTVNGVAFTISGSGTLQVTAAIPNTANNKLFARLRATMP